MPAIQSSEGEERSFAVELDFTDEELKAYQRVTNRARRQYVMQHWFLVASLAAVGVSYLGAGLAIMAGVATSHGSGLIAVILFVAFWIGVYLPGMLVSTASRQRYYRSFRSIWDGSLLYASQNGFALRRSNVRAVYRKAAIAAITRDRGLILIWTSPSLPLPVPERLLTETQRATLMSLAPSRHPSIE
jgi:uncharacterized membrane protein YphA (DoxX/SURF4 family)